MDLVDKILSQQKTDWLKEDTSSDENQQKKKVIFLKTHEQLQTDHKTKQKLQII